MKISIITLLASTIFVHAQAIRTLEVRPEDDWSGSPWYDIDIGYDTSLSKDCICTKEDAEEVVMLLKAYYLMYVSQSEAGMDTLKSALPIHEAILKWNKKLEEMQ